MLTGKNIKLKMHWTEIVDTIKGKRAEKNKSLNLKWLDIKKANEVQFLVSVLLRQ